MGAIRFGSSEVSIASSSASISGQIARSYGSCGQIGVSIASSSASISGRQNRQPTGMRRRKSLNRFFVSEYLRTDVYRGDAGYSYRVSIASSSASISGRRERMEGLAYER